jgi:hypothetical protein
MGKFCFSCVNSSDFAIVLENFAKFFYITNIVILLEETPAHDPEFTINELNI